MASTLESRTITVPSIVDYYTDEELNSEYHAKAEYEQAIEKYGAIYKILDLNNSGMSAQDMQEFVREWIRKHYFDGVLSFTVKGVDLHLLGYNKDKLSIGDRIPVEFLDVYKTPVTKVLTCISAQYDILNPGNSTYKIGIPDVSMDVKLPNKNRGSSVGKKSSSYSSSGSAGTSNLYKYYKELDTKAQIQAEEIEFLAQNISLHADNIDYITNGVEGVQQSAVIQNEGEVINVVGSFDVKDNYYGDWPEWDSSTSYKKGARVSYNNGTMGYICLKDIPEGARIPLSNTEYWLKSTGRKAVIFKDGAQAVIDDVNGQQVSVGTKLGEHDDYITTFEGSALWTQRDNITGVCGEYDVVLDPVTGKKTLVIKAGGGIKIRKNGTEFGLYDEDSLTGGIMTKKINTNGLPKWTKHTHYSVGKKINYNFQSYICIEDHDSTDVFDPSKWNEYDPTETKILGDVVEIEGSDHVSISVSDKISSQDTVINGVSTKVETFEGSELWSDRNNIVGVCGEYEVQTDPSTGVKTLIIKSGGGLKIRRNNTEFGIYDEGSLTAGIMVDRINARNWPAWTEGTNYAVGDKVTINNTGYICNTAHQATKPIDMSKWTYSTSTKIKGDVVNIEARQVRVGDTTNVDAWMTETGGNLDDLSGLVADKITAYEAEFRNIKADYLRTNNLSAQIGQLDWVNVKNLSCQTSMIFGQGATFSAAGSSVTFSSGLAPNVITVKPGNFIKNVRVIPTANANEYKLQYKLAFASNEEESGWTDGGTFSKGPSIDYLSGSWSGHLLTVSTNPATGKTYTVDLIDTTAAPVSGPDQNITVMTDGTPTISAANNRYLTAPIKFVTVVGGQPPTITTRRDGINLTINATATYNSAWNSARSCTYDNLPTTDIGYAIDSTYNKISIKYPNQNGDATLNSQDYTLNVNSNFTPQGSSGHVVAAEIKTGSNVVSRITVPMETKSITANGSYTPSSGNVGFKSVNVSITPALSGRWTTTDAQGTRFTVTSTPSGTPNPYYATVYAENGTATKNPNWSAMVDIPISIKSNIIGSETPVDTGYSNPIHVDVSSLLQAKTGNSKITSNGTYGPDNGYIGLSSIQVAVPTGYTDVKTKFGSASSGYYIVATDGTGGSEIANSSTYYKLGTSGSTSSTKVQVQTTGGTRVTDTPELSVGYLYTNGQNSVTVTDVSIYGSPAATATSISVQATASNGATKIGSIGITTQRNNAYSSGWTDCYGTVTGAQVTSGTADKTIPLGYGGHALIAAQAKASSSASAVSNKYIIDVTAPANNYQTGWDDGFAAGAPTGATLGSKVTGTTYNVSIARGSYTAVSKTIDVSTAYTDARVGYYTQAQYNAYGTERYRAGSQAVNLSTKWSNGTPYTSGSNNKLTVETTGRVNSSGNADNITREWNIYVTSGDNIAYARIGGTSGTIIAQVTHNKYSTGYTNGSPKTSGHGNMTLGDHDAQWFNVSVTRNDGTTVLCNTVLDCTAAMQAATINSVSLDSGSNYAIINNRYMYNSVVNLNGADRSMITNLDLTSVWNQAKSQTNLSFSVTGIGAAILQSQPPITANAFGGSISASQTLSMEKATYYIEQAGLAKRCVNLKKDNTIFGRIDTQDIYDEGVAAGTPAASDFQVTAPISASPSYSAGGTELSSWVSVIGNAVARGYYVYFDVWSSKNTSIKKRYYMKF